MEQFLIILRGPFASGKSTIARKLRNFEKKIVWLKVDNFKDFFEDDIKAIEDENNLALVSLEYLLNKGYSVVMDGVFQNVSVIEKGVEIGNKNKVKIVVFELKCCLEVLIARDKVRLGIKEGCRKIMDEKEIEKVFEIVKNNPYLSAIQLDTETFSIEECTSMIKEKVEF